MRSRSVSLGIVALIAMLVPAIAHAHVSIWPRDSMQGATERYIVRVPTEGKVTTTGADLEVPAGVVVEVVSMPMGWTSELKRQGDRDLLAVEMRIVPALPK